MNMNSALLRELRKKHGLTQEALAENIHISRSAYAKLEGGQTHGTTDEALALSEALGCSLTDLINLEKTVTIQQCATSIENKQANHNQGQIDSFSYADSAVSKSVSEMFATLIQSHAMQQQQMSDLLSRITEMLGHIEKNIGRLPV